LAPGVAAPAGAQPAIRRDIGGIEAGAPRPAFGKPAPAAAPSAVADPLAGLHNGARPATRLPDSDPFAAQREAFLAAERARKAEAAAAGHGAHEDARMPSQRRRSSSGGHGLFGAPEKRSLILAYVYWYFGAALGIHRFYCGATETGWYQVALFVGGLVLMLIWPPLGLVSLLIWFVWSIVDLFLIPGLMRRFKAENAPNDHLDFA
jgi:TM2 domain-containing membrane protein YozV